jgi:hypothetical protein
MTLYPHEVLMGWWGKEMETPTSYWWHVFCMLFAMVSLCTGDAWIGMINTYMHTYGIATLGYQDFIVVGITAYSAVSTVLLAWGFSGIMIWSVYK